VRQYTLTDCHTALPDFSDIRRSVPPQNISERADAQCSNINCAAQHLRWIGCRHAQRPNLFIVQYRANNAKGGAGQLADSVE